MHTECGSSFRGFPHPETSADVPIILSNYYTNFAHENLLLLFPSRGKLCGGQLSHWTDDVEQQDEIQDYATITFVSHHHSVDVSCWHGNVATGRRARWTANCLWQATGKEVSKSSGIRHEAPVVSECHLLNSSSGSTIRSVTSHRHIITAALFVLSLISLQMLALEMCLQCFHTVGWASGRASGL